MSLAPSLRRCTALAGGGALLLLLGCGPVRSVTIGQGGAPHGHHVHQGHGPPPHAPAHGYRWKASNAYRHHHRGSAEIELVFDSGLGVYVVVGLPAHYYWNGTYLRVDGGRWYASSHLDVGWKLHAEQALPRALRAKHAKEKRPKRAHPARRR